jgi:AraC-like DNA-binding protein
VCFCLILNHQTPPPSFGCVSKDGRGVGGGHGTRLSRCSYNLAAMNCVSPAFFGRQQRSAFTMLPRHRHECSYLALVLSGGYEEAGDRGRHQVSAGNVVVHGAFEAHLNRYDRAGAEVLNIALPAWTETASPWMETADPDAAVRLAERDPQDAAAFLLSTMKPLRILAADWPDDLATALVADPNLRLREWARMRGLADATVSRGFRKVFGVTPSAYRAQVRGRLAWRHAVCGSEPLSSVALDSGFCDQAHMTRTVHAVTGQPPGTWRKQVK